MAHQYILIFAAYFNVDLDAVHIKKGCLSTASFSNLLFIGSISFFCLTLSLLRIVLTAFKFWTLNLPAVISSPFISWCVSSASTSITRHAFWLWQQNFSR